MRAADSAKRARSEPLAESDTVAQRYIASDPDVRLMLRVREDDAEAFRQLVERYQDRLVSLLAYQVRSRDQAEDLAQEVFLRVFRARKRYVPGAKFATWLFTIAGNVASNALRSKSRRKETATPVAGPDETGAVSLQPAAESAAMPTRQADRTELRKAVQAAIESLGERQRLAVVLAKFEHLGYAEIAEVLGIQPQAVKSLLARARENLRVALAPYLERGEAVAGLAGTAALDPGLMATDGDSASGGDR